MIASKIRGTACYDERSKRDGGRARESNDWKREVKVSGQTYDKEGIRFEHPADWELETNEEEGVRTVAANEPDGLGFVIFTIDPSLPEPTGIAAAALGAMREEYPDLDSFPAVESINGHEATGHDIEFMAMDMTNSAIIRCFRTPLHTILAFGQWSDLGADNLGDLVRDIVNSIEETE